MIFHPYAGTALRGRFSQFFWRVVSYRRRNQPCQISSRSVKGFGFYGYPKSGVSHWLWSSPFQQLLTTVLHFVIIFLLLVRYVPNVAKRSIWDQCKKKYILRTDQPATGNRRPATSDRPTTDLTFGEISNCHISLREGSSDPLHVWFYGGVFGVGGSNGANSGLTEFNE